MTDPLTVVAGGDGAPNVAIDVLPDDAAGTFQLDVSLLDDPELLGWAFDGWVNVVCNVRRVATRRGASRAQGPLTRTETGTCTVVLEDTERRFDPTVNADAIHPGIAFRVRAWTAEYLEDAWSATLFTGRIGADLTVAYQQSGAPVVSFTATDVIAVLARYGSTGRADPGVGAGDTLRGRVDRVVAELGLDPWVVSGDSDTAYAATMPHSSLAKGWADVTAAVDAELGRVWVNAFDELVVRSRGSLLTGPVRGTLSDWHGETVGDDTVHCCYRDPSVVYGTESLTTRAIGARRVPRPADGSTPAASAVVQIDDAYSTARYTEGTPAAYENRSLELQTDAQLTPWAEALLLATSRPELRVDKVGPAPEGVGFPAWQAVCETDIGDRWSYRQHPQIGATIALTLGVSGIEHDIAPDGWWVTWTTELAPTPGVGNPSGWVILDVSDLDSGDVLAPFGGTVPGSGALLFGTGDE